MNEKYLRIIEMNLLRITLQMKEDKKALDEAEKEESSEDDYTALAQGLRQAVVVCSALARYCTMLNTNKSTHNKKEQQLVVVAVLRGLL